MTEYFDIVDENDKVVGRATREECHKYGYRHRGVFILVVNSDGKILLQKRSMLKDIRPGLWTTSVSGHMDSGETYEKAAAREMKEEIGVLPKISDAYFSVLDTDRGKYYLDNEIDRVFFARHNGPFKINKDEVDQIAFFSLAEIVKMIKKGVCTPASGKIINEVSRNKELLKRLGLS